MHEIAEQQQGWRNGAGFWKGPRSAGALIYLKMWTPIFNDNR
jgi:hypothetical protein